MLLPDILTYPPAPPTHLPRLPTCRYYNDDQYEGYWQEGKRWGHGRYEERKGDRRTTVYFGAWENDKRTGYGVFEDTVRQVYCKCVRARVRVCTYVCMYVHMYVCMGEGCIYCIALCDMKEVSNRK